MNFLILLLLHLVHIVWILCYQKNVNHNWPLRHDTRQRYHQSRHESRCRNSSHPSDSTSEPMASYVDCGNKFKRSCAIKRIIEKSLVFYCLKETQAVETLIYGLCSYSFSRSPRLSQQLWFELSQDSKWYFFNKNSKNQRF